MAHKQQRRLIISRVHARRLRLLCLADHAHCLRLLCTSRPYDTGSMIPHAAQRGGLWPFSSRPTQRMHIDPFFFFFSFLQDRAW